MYIFFITIIGQVENFISSIDPAYFDIVKIFAGTIGWIGGLTLFMWLKEKNKKRITSLVRIESHL